MCLVLLLAGCGASAAVPDVTADGAAVPVPVATPAPTTVVTPPPTAAAAPRLVGCSARAAACVSTRQRLAWLQEDGRLSHGPVRVSLGMAGHRTPRGHFRVAWKDAEHTSSIYGLDMPWSVFFATGGIAFHEGALDEPSHGCVHLGPVAAEAFFRALDRGDRVHVF